MKNLDMKKIDKNVIIPKLFFAILFSCLFVILTQLNMIPLFGMEMNFSAGIFFGPVIARLIGIPFGIGSILLAQLIGSYLGYYEYSSILSLVGFFPILFGGIYFSRMFKSDKRILVIPLACMILFNLHPIGREVWYYSLFWLIPIIITKFKDKFDKILKRDFFKTFFYALGTVFTDHAVGSVIYLWALNIPAQFWIMALPISPIERLFMAGGVTVTYTLMKKPLEVMQKAFVRKAIAIASVQKQKEVNKIVQQSS